MIEIRSPFKLALILIGWISLALGFLGVFLPLLPTTPLCVVSSILFFQKFPQITSMAHDPTEAWALDSELGAIWEYKQTGQGDGYGLYGDGFSHFFVCVGDRSSMEGNLRPDSWRSVMVHLDTAIATFGIPRLPH